MAAKDRSKKKKKEKKKKLVVIQRRSRLDFKPNKKKKIHQRPWSDLPADLLSEEFMLRLSSADQIRFRSVCKSWQLPIRERGGSPWLLTYEWKRKSSFEDDGPNPSMACVCKLFEPTQHQKPYAIDEIILIGQELVDTDLAQVRASKHGWLLFSWEKHIDLTSFFLFSPFTKQIITLPDLDHSFDLGHSFDHVELEYQRTRTHIVTFSSDPYSPDDCVFFVMHDYPLCNKVTISTCRRGDKNWITRVLARPRGGIQDVVYNGGFFYCVSGYGALASYSVDQQDWSFVSPEPSELWVCKFHHMIKCDGGELLLLYLDTHNLRKGEKNLCHILKFSWSRMAWVRVHKRSLRNQALFIGCTSFSVSEAFGATGNIVNGINYLDSLDRKSKFYSLKDGKCHERDPSSTYGVWLPKSRLEEVVWVEPSQLSK